MDEQLVNHPVHLDEDTRGLSAFIPFCFFGDNLVGKNFSNFQTPVCSQFREKVVRNQVCYEADINQYKNSVNWAVAIQTGFSFIVDTNDEYNVKNLLVKQGKWNHPIPYGNFVTVYKKPSYSGNFRILLKTISKI